MDKKNIDTEGFPAQIRRSKKQYVWLVQKQQDI